MGAAPRLLVTGGPTHEPIDAVRFIGNRSSGRLAVAVATEAATRGLATTLLLGPATVGPPEDTGVRVVRFRTADDLQELLRDEWPGHDVLVMVAAVADYRVARGGAAGGPGADGKIRRSGKRLILELEPVPDLLAALAPMTRPDQTVIGFALEPAATLEASARAKLARKRLDAIVANPLETMDAETITAVVHLRTGAVMTPPADLAKASFAAWLLDRMPEIRAQPAPSNASTK